MSGVLFSVGVCVCVCVCDLLIFSHLPVHSRATASAVRTWLAYADVSHARKESTRRALYKMSPEGRGKSKALRAWKAKFEQRATMRRGGAAFFNGAAMRALQVLDEPRYI